MREFRFPNRIGEMLDGTLFRVPRSRAGVICLPGFARHGEEKKFLFLGEALARAGISTLTFSYTGWGRSEGNSYPMSLPRLASDAERALGFFQAECGVSRFGVFAHSLGACVASLLFSKFSDPFQRTVFLAPALSQSALMRYWFERKRGSTPFLEADFQKSLKEDRAVKDKLTGQEKTVGRQYFEEMSRRDYTSLVLPNSAFERRTRGSRILHVHGQADETVPLKFTHLSGCRQLLVPGDHDLEGEREFRSWIPEAVKHFSILTQLGKEGERDEDQGSQAYAR